AALDLADGSADGVIDLSYVAATGTSYEFVGEDGGDQSGYSVSSAGDVDGDGNDDLLIGAYQADDGGGTDSGSTYLVNADDLAALDIADGTADGVIDLSYVAATGTSYEFVGEDIRDKSGRSVSSAGDVDGDGNDDLLIGAYTSDDGGGDSSGSTYLINADDLAALDLADGTADGVIDLSYVAATGTSYEFVGENEYDYSGRSVSSAGDVDNDGQDDLLIGAYEAADGSGGFQSGSTYLIRAADLATLDAADGTTDGVIELGNVACFCAGTRIATPTGCHAVEALAIGDRILTAEGRAVPVKWIGRQTVVTRFGPAERLMPVRFAAGSLGKGLPQTDLTVTADHGMLVEGVICHAGALVNGTTITRVPLAEMGETYTVYHVETENHEIILANGAPAETFIDNVSRRVFDNFAEFEALYGDVPEMEELPYPRAMSARQVPAWTRRGLMMPEAC
uniref:Hint domain-containing protein n=1 Tax=Nioella ostreopsis TaxID=2448479 RepID=UPI000FD9B2AB